MKHLRLAICSFTLLFLLAVSVGHAQVILNPSFELDDVPPGTFETTPDPTITDWTTTSTPQGTASLASNNNGLFGDTPFGNQYALVSDGSISQVVGNFIEGDVYTLSVNAANLISIDDASPFNIQVSGDILGGATEYATFTATGAFPYDNNPIPFLSFSLTFIPIESGSATISFVSTVYATGVELDNVAIINQTVSAPEPATYAGLFLGLSALGFLWRRQARYGVNVIG